MNTNEIDDIENINNDEYDDDELNDYDEKPRSGFLSRFKSPFKGIFDIILVMGITIAAVVYLGPVIIDSAFSPQQQPLFYRTEFSHMCPDTGWVIKDYIKDDDGNVIGTLYIDYHENGAFKSITEHNDLDNAIRVIFYSEENEFLYWTETLFDENGEVISETTYNAEGFPIG